MTETAGPGGLGGWEQRWLLPGELLAGATQPVRRTGRDWVVDILLFTLAAGMWALMLATAGERGYVPDWLTVLDPPLGALACLALWWRRRFPLLLALAIVPVGAFSYTCFGALTVILLTLGLRVRLRPALLALALNLAAALPYLLAYTVPNEGGWPAGLFVFAYYLFLFAWGAGMRVRRQLVARLREDAERERADHARRLADARRAEREAIAREMHDVLAHRISLLSVHAGALAYRTGPAAGEAATPLSNGEISESAQLIRDTAHQALQELRQVLTVLRGADGSDGAALPRIADIRALVAEAEEAGQRVVLTEEYDAGAARTLRGPVQRTAYRVVQEGLTNARKHAPGAPVVVAVGGKPGDELTVLVRNELPAGASPAAIPGAGAGLAGLEERTVLDGGSLRHGANAHDGTFELLARLPWQA
ncbi:sensor histidine kinase [Streptomyces sp. 6N223]|uniref:sensor histidine kinase n=1 Tax=Streptomyces sp. 6N223 TaxID=3457412 RepID=UPI003FD1BBB3